VVALECRTRGTRRTQNEQGETNLNFGMGAQPEDGVSMQSL